MDGVWEWEPGSRCVEPPTQRLSHPGSPRAGPEPAFPRGAPSHGMPEPGSPRTRLGCQPLLGALKEASLVGPHGS